MMTIYYYTDHDDMDKALMMQEVKSDMSGEVNISVFEALKDENWRPAVKDEYGSLTDMQTWKLVDKPKDVKPLTCRWIFIKKGDGKYKARFVARGFQQREDQDYFEIFSPVARHVSIRLLLSIAASEKMSVIIFDVKTAFLHGKLKKTIYMNQTEGFDDKTGRVCLLNKSIYGLKQALIEWKMELSEFMKSLGFKETCDDPCVYYNQDRSIIVALHVVDGQMIGRDLKVMNTILDKLDAKFKITRQSMSNGPIMYLALQIRSTSKGIFVNQSEYMKKMLK